MAVWGNDVTYVMRFSPYYKLMICQKKVLTSLRGRILRGQNGQAGRIGGPWNGRPNRGIRIERSCEGFDRLKGTGIQNAQSWEQLSKKS